MHRHVDYRRRATVAKTTGLMVVDPVMSEAPSPLKRCSWRRGRGTEHPAPDPHIGQPNHLEVNALSSANFDSDALRCAVIGGSFYGGGGGGAPAKGMEAGEAALLVGDVILVDIDDVPDDAVLLTMSAVGAPAAKDAYVKPYHYLKAVELLMERYDGKLYGFITNECGGAATVNGWIQAAAFGLPVVDAPCNGRAHPTGVMGSMGLHSVPGYVSLQPTGVGGDPSAAPT